MATSALEKKRDNSPMRIRLTRRGWIVLVVIPVFLLALAGSLLAAMMSNSVMASAQQPTGVQTVEVTVLPGDTLWDLAGEYATGYDVEAAIDQIHEMNSLQGATLQAGQTLQIPVLAQP